MYRVFIAIKFYKDARNRKSIENISKVLEKLGFKTIHMSRDFEDWGKKRISSPEELMKFTFKSIDKSDILLAECSEKSVGVGMEIGYALSKNKKIVILAKENSKISNTILGITDNIFFYTKENLNEKLKEISRLINN